MDWIYVGILIGAIAYLALIVLTFLENRRQGKARIEQTRADIDRLSALLTETEHARMEAEERAAKIEEETLLYEQQCSELQQIVRAALPPSGSAEAHP